MQINLSNPKIINEFRYNDVQFETFQSVSRVNDTNYTFSRLVNQANYLHSRISVNGKIIGYGEDPRAFNLLGTPACYSVQYLNDRFIPRLYLENGNDWLCVDMHLVDKINPGKNWGPFVYNNEVYFVHEISPFRVLKLSGDELVTVFAQPIETNKMAIDNYSVLRGGCNGLDIGNGIILGFGHNNFASDQSNIYTIQHRPFAWSINMLNNSVDIIEVNYQFDDAYKIIDPTSFFQIDNQYYLQTIETEVVWNNTNQQARNCLYQITFNL